MSRLENITNLRLAWRRILTAQNYAYRNLQRLELESFSWGAEEYLSQLRDELRTNASGLIYLTTGLDVVK